MVLDRHLKYQAGGSPIKTLIVLVIMGYGIFVGLQYVPQWVEARGVQSILNEIKADHAGNPVGSIGEARTRLIKMLQVNEMNDMVDKFTISNRRGSIVIAFSYDRDLNLGYEQRVIHYGQTVTL